MNNELSEVAKEKPKPQEQFGRFRIIRLNEAAEREGKAMDLISRSFPDVDVGKARYTQSKLYKSINIGKTRITSPSPNGQNLSGYAVKWGLGANPWKDARCRSKDRD